MEVETAIRRHLLGVQELTSDVQQRVWKYQADEVIDGTGRAGVVINRGPGWATPDRTQTVEFPRLIVDVIVDPTRNETGEIAVLNAEDRGRAISRTIRRALTYPNLRGVRVGAFGSRPGVLVISSQLLAEPRPISSTDYHTRAEQKAAGDTITVRTEYALEVAHDD